jgi:hypothetical protein
VNELAAMLQQENGATDQADAERWQYRWHEPIPFRERLEIVSPASLPGAGFGRAIYFACGAMGGLLLAGLIVLLRRRPKFVLQIALCGLAGSAVAGALSLLANEQHTARAVLRMSPPFDPDRLSGAAPAIPVSESVERLRREVLDSDGFYATLRHPKFALDEAAAMALYQKREQAFLIRMLDPGSEVAAAASFEITFSHSDENLARALVSELLTEIDARDKGDQESTDHPDAIEIAVQPSLEKEAVTHYRLQLTLAGAAMGILLAIARWSAPPTAHP